MLIVDDDPLVADAVRGLLDDVAAVRAVTSAEDAERALADQRWDILLADLDLGGPSGIDLVGRGRALQPGLRCVLMTGRPSLETAVAALRLDVRDYLEKPISMKRLRSAIAAQWKQRQAELEHGRLVRRMRTALLNAHETETWTRALLDVVGAVVILADSGGRVIEFNEPAAVAFGRDRLGRRTPVWSSLGLRPGAARALEGTLVDVASGIRGDGDVVIPCECANGASIGLTVVPLRDRQGNVEVVAITGAVAPPTASRAVDGNACA